MKWLSIFALFPAAVACHSEPPNGALGSSSEAIVAAKPAPSASVGERFFEPPPPPAPTGSTAPPVRYGDNGVPLEPPPADLGRTPDPNAVAPELMAKSGSDERRAEKARTKQSDVEQRPVTPPRAAPGMAALQAQYLAEREARQRKGGNIAADSVAEADAKATFFKNAVKP